MGEPYREDGRVEQLQEENALLKQDVRSLESRHDELVRSLMRSRRPFWANFLLVAICGVLCGGLSYVLTIHAFHRGGAVGLLEEDQEEIAERVAKRTQAQIARILSERPQIEALVETENPSSTKAVAPALRRFIPNDHYIYPNEVERGYLRESRMYIFRAQASETAEFEVEPVSEGFFSCDADPLLRVVDADGFLLEPLEPTKGTRRAPLVFPSTGSYYVEVYNVSMCNGPFKLYARP